MAAPKPLILAIDIGTGSVRAGIVDLDGVVVAVRSVPHETSYPKHGFVEQDPEAWWKGARIAIADVLNDVGNASLLAVIACGQMHAPVLIDNSGALVASKTPLWNDKRASGIAKLINEEVARGSRRRGVNPATSAWPGVKLAHLAQTDPEMLASARHVLMPKDWINFRLTGHCAIDWTEAGSSYMIDPDTWRWCDDTIRSLGLDSKLLPDIISPFEVVGRITPAAAFETGLPVNLPVFAGLGDYPSALVGSGVIRSGQVSDITGTSFLMTRLNGDAIRNDAVMNVATANGPWGAFAVVDAAGDAVRWARQTLDRDVSDFARLSREAASATIGANGLLFLPYLTGERLGQGDASRAAFIGLTASHTAADLHRALLEGVVFAMREAFEPISTTIGRPEVIYASGGGARSELWLRMKADTFGSVIIPTADAEAGLVGAAAVAFVGLGRLGSLGDAVASMVRYSEPVEPDPVRGARYQEMYDAFKQVREMYRSVNSISGRLQ